MNIMKTNFFKHINYGTLMLAAALLIGFTACNESDLNEELLGEETESFEEEQDVQEELDDVSDLFGAFADIDVLEGGRVASASDTLPPDTAHLCLERIHLKEEKTIIFDFGDGCVGLDGVLRSGKIIITYTNHWLVPGAVITKTFENYFVNNHQVEGFITLTNISATPNSFPTFNLL